MAMRKKLLRYARGCRLATRALSLLLIAYWLILCLGIPLPVSVKVAKDRSRPFPCMDSMCGCRSAESCWRSCCCHTNAEKLAWAKQHGVTPPAFVVAAARREAASKCANCAAHAAAKSCCHQHDHAADGSSALSAAGEKHGQQTPSVHESGTDEDTTTEFVALASVHRCQGSLHKLLVSLPALPPESSSPSFIDLPGQWLTLVDQHSLAGYALPAVPPPRVLA